MGENKNKEVRLNKYIATCGICSRREADKIIEASEITVNGVIASCGSRISDGDIVKYKGSIIKPIIKKMVVACYKPKGVTCSEKDKFAEILIQDIFQFKERLTYAGRLDKDSEGLLLLTNDGDLIQAMMKGSHAHEKEYIVRVNKPITPKFIEMMEHGIFIEELNQVTRICKVTKQKENEFKITLTQGLNRQIRRMCKILSYEVVFLKRIRVLNIEIDDLLPGEYRILTETEQKELYDICGKRGC